jgi:hypothetical protein
VAAWLDVSRDRFLIAGIIRQAVVCESSLYLLSDLDAELYGRRSDEIGRFSKEASADFVEEV